MQKRRRRQRTSPGEMSGVETGATENLWVDVPVPQGTYQGQSRRYHRLPAVDRPVSSQRQCIAGGADQQRQQCEHHHTAYTLK